MSYSITDPNSVSPVAREYDSIENHITLFFGEGAKLPDPLVNGSFDLIWRNSSDYSIPNDDPNIEIVRCIARYEDTLVVMRSQEGTLNSDKNIPDKIYNMLLISDIKDLSFYNIIKRR